MNKIKVSQKLSLIGKTKKQIACIKSLGLKRINDSKIIEDTPEKSWNDKHCETYG